jgi:hypothetical protein
MKINHLTLLGVLAASSVNGATTVGFENITPSSTMVPEPTFPLANIADGITGTASSLNGFVSNSLGTITFSFDQSYTIGSFLLWNDIVVNAEGIDDFELSFFNAADTPITVSFSTSYTAPLGQVAGEEYLFPDSVPNVARVDLEVLSTQASFGGGPRTEIREVDFGVVPEPTSLALTFLGLGTFFLRRNRSKNSLTH